MIEFNISVDLSRLVYVMPAFREAMGPAIKMAIYEITKETETRWKEAVARAPLWDGREGKSDKERYLASIRSRPTGPFAAEVYSDFYLAEKIETGRPERDLKKMLDSSAKVRQSKDGKRYLIIPFEHNTPGNKALAPDIPKDVYKSASQLSPSRITGETRRASGTGAHDIGTRKRLTVHQNIYSWGGRLPAGMAPKLRSYHKTDPYAGMVRFDTSIGRKKESRYLTFRVMKEGSTGWIIPPRPGLFLARQVTQEMQAIADRRFSQMIEEAMANVMTSATE